MRLIRWADTRAMPWKNGGGITHEVAVHPEGAGLDEFGWRISMAEVASDGPFSRFGGIDRTLALIDGAGLRLEFSDGTEAVIDAEAAPFAFRGEAEVRGCLLRGTIIDLNVMTRRECWRHSVRAVEVRGRAGLSPMGVVAVVCRSGALSVPQHAVSLMPRDCLILRPEGQGLVLEGDGSVFVAEIREVGEKAKG